MHDQETSVAGPGCTIWLTGLPSSGKTTLAMETARRLGRTAEVLDGDAIRRNFFPELGFSRHDRNENVMRVGRLALMLAKHGVTVIVAVIAPYREARQWVRYLHLEAAVRYHEVWIDAPIEVCVERDVRGLYRKARLGELFGLTGFDDVYEIPTDPSLHLRTNQVDVETCVRLLLRMIESPPRS
jgi:adenylylsulfate kinase